MFEEHPCPQHNAVKLKRELNWENNLEMHNFRECVTRCGLFWALAKISVMFGNVSPLCLHAREMQCQPPGVWEGIWAYINSSFFGRLPVLWNITSVSLA